MFITYCSYLNDSSPEQSLVFILMSLAENKPPGIIVSVFCCLPRSSGHPVVLALILLDTVSDMNDESHANIHFVSALISRCIFVWTGMKLFLHTMVIVQLWSVQFSLVQNGTYALPKAIFICSILSLRSLATLSSVRLSTVYCVLLIWEKQPKRKFGLERLLRAFV